MIENYYFPLKFTGRQTLFFSTNIRQSSQLFVLNNSAIKEGECLRDHPDIFEKHGLFFFITVLSVVSILEISDVENLMALP